MNSTIVSHPSFEKLPPTKLLGCLLGAMALGLAVVLWHLSSSPGQVGVAGRHSSTGAGQGRDSSTIGDLVRWRGKDGLERLLVSNGQHDAIVVYAADTGAPLAVTAKGRFKDISGLALHGDLLFVTDLGRRRVQALSLPGLRPCRPQDAAGPCSLGGRDGKVRR